MSSERHEVQNLITKYLDDIAIIEEKEEDITRRIQIMENIIPVVTVWYMWKIAQINETGISTKYLNEEEAQKQLSHLETILEELQEAEYCLKQEENVMRVRVEELKTSSAGVFYEPIQVEVEESKAAKERKRIKSLEENKIIFKDFLENPNTDWINTTQDLCEKVNKLKETLVDTNNELKNKDNYIKQLKYDLSSKGKDVNDKIEELETQNKAFVSELIQQEQERDAEEADMNKKVLSTVQEVIGEVETIKKSLLKKRVSESGEVSEDTKNVFPPVRNPFVEEEEEIALIRLIERETSNIHVQPDFYKKPLVSTPDEVLPGSPISPIRDLSFPSPQMFEAFETINETSFEDDSEIRIRTAGTATRISIPIDISDLSLAMGTSLVEREPIAMSPDVEESQREKLASFENVGGQPDVPVLTPLLANVEDFERQAYPSEVGISVVKTKTNSLKDLVKPISTRTSEAQAGVSSSSRKSSIKSLDKPHVSSTVSEDQAKVPHQMQPPEQKSSSAEETTPETTETLKDQTEILTKAPLERQDSIKKGFPPEPDVSLQDAPTTSSKASEKLAVEVSVNKDQPGFTSVEASEQVPGESNTASVNLEPQVELNQTALTSTPISDAIILETNAPLAGSVKPGLTSVAASEQIPSTSKEAADTLEAQATMSEPSKVPYTDEVQPMPSGLKLQQEEETAKSRPSVASLTGQTLQSKCRVKDHLIKNMADQLRDLASRNKWSGNKLFRDISSDPVKTYDFDRGTLHKYIKGQEPRDLAPALRSNEPYTSSNPLNVKVGRKLDENSILLEWGPSPAQEVVGFQIFINGEFKYWVHSAKRSKALLHPVNLATQLEISVSAVSILGDVLHRSSITYHP